MKFLLLSTLIVLSDQQKNNINLLRDKAFNLGLKEGTVTDKATALNIMSCLQPSIVACKPIDNITADAKNCILQKSGSYYAKVIGYYQKMNQCLKEDLFTLLDKVLPVAKPIIQPLYNQLCGNISAWNAKKLAAAVVANKTWGWINDHTTKAVINQYCTSIVNKGGVNKAEWACCKNPGNQAIDFSSYACYKLTPSS